MKDKQTLKALPYLAPALILMSVFVVYPIINTTILSFNEPGDAGYGLGNYIYVLTKLDSFKVGFKNTMLYTIFVTSIELVIALAISYALTKVERLKVLFQTTYFLPYVTSVIAIGTVFKIMFNSEYGIINYILGLDIAWLSADYAIVSMIILGVWKGLAFNILIVFTGLSTIDTSLEKAAKVDGFSSLKTFIKIKLPQIRGILMYLLTINIIFNIKVYEEVVSLFGRTQAGPGGSANTIVYELYSRMLSDPKGAAAIALVLLVLVIVIRQVLLLIDKFTGGK